MDKNHKNTIANAENASIGSLYEKQFKETGLQELFPGAIYIGQFKNTVIGSRVEHMFEHEGTIYVADCKGGRGLDRRDDCLDVLAESAEFSDWKETTCPERDYKFIIITTNLPPKGAVASLNRIALAKRKHGLHAVYVWNPKEPEENCLMEFFNG